MKPKTGRPSRIDAVIDTTEDGKPVTVSTRIIEGIRRGLPENLAAAKAGVPMPTYRTWCIDAARASERLLVNPKARTTARERLLIEFSRAVDAAAAEAEGRIMDAMRTLAEMGTTRKIVRKIDPLVMDPRTNAPQVLESTITEETRLPSFAALRWIAENQYGRRAPLEVRLDAGALPEADLDTELANVLGGWAAEHLAEPLPVVHTNGEEPEG